MTIKEFVDRLMLEMGDLRAEQLKYAEYFTIATEALKTVEAVYKPLVAVREGTLETEEAESREILSIVNLNNKNFFAVGRFYLLGERYLVDYEYAKITDNSFLPCYGYKAYSGGVRIAFSPGAAEGTPYKVVLYYVHPTSYFANENNDLEMPENYVLIALTLAKQYLYSKYGLKPVEPIQQQEQQQNQ